MILRRDNAFYECVRYTMFTCRMVGILPMSGLLKSNSDELRVGFMTPYIIYFLTSVFLLNIIFLIHLYSSTQPVNKFKDFGGLMVQATVVLTVAILIRLTINWKIMMKQIEVHERLLPILQKPQHIYRKAKRITIILLILGLIEHVAILLNSGYLITKCYYNPDKQDFVKTYYLFFYRWFYEVFPFSYGSALILQVCMLQTSLIFNILYALVFVVTLFLIYRFQNFNRLMRIRQKECLRKTYTHWSDLQMHYTRLSRLVKVIDEHISPFILILFLANLITICKHIYDVIIVQTMVYNDNTNCGARFSTNPISMSTYLIRATYQLSKSISVAMVMAHLHNLSREPLEALHTVPPTAYNLELQRFMDQVYHSNITLSGWHLFHVNKGTVLSMLSTIITYELVLLQLPLIYGK